MANESPAQQLASGIFALFGLGAAYYYFYGSGSKDDTPIVHVTDRTALNINDVASMHRTYDQNQSRFFRDYKGKTFSGRVLFENANQDLIFKSTYHVRFKIPRSNAFDGDIGCDVEADDPTIKLVQDANKGEAMNVAGTVDDSLMGAILLKGCEIAP